jgi:small-conductance mechanosensitive channel
VEHTIKTGDVILVKDRRVQVEKVGVRNTVAKTRNGEEVLIPNSTVAQSMVMGGAKWPVLSNGGL